MKKLLYITLSIFSLYTLSSCNSSIKGEGEITEKEIKLNTVKQITAKGNYRLICLLDEKEPRMVIETYKNLVENVKIDNSQNQLTLSESKNVKDTDLYNIYVYNAEFENFEIHNNITVEVNSPIRINKLNITLFDNSKFLENNLIANELNIKANDKAKINLQGSGTKLDIKAGKSANISAPFYTTANAHIILSDVATAEINCKDKVTGQISGNSELMLIGNPAKDITQKDLAQIKYK